MYYGRCENREYFFPLLGRAFVSDSDWLINFRRLL